MRKLAVWLINLYQAIVSPVFRIVFGPAICRYSPSCSEYTKIQIQRNGLVRGSLLGLKRLSTCHPFAIGATKKV